MHPMRCIYPEHAAAEVVFCQEYDVRKSVYQKLTKYQLRKLDSLSDAEVIDNATQ